MARRFRRKSYRRRLRRRGFRRRKSLRSKVASINRRLASEVKKNDNVIGITANNFTQLTTVGLQDYAYCYPVLDATMSQGTQLDDIIGEQIKMKYLYLGFHLQTANATVPTTLRIMVVQDRNYREYQNGAPTAIEMYQNLFGMTANTVTGGYVAYSDVTLLPYNPLQPGRFRVIRDFKMCVAPGWKQDYYRKLIVLQRSTNSRGKIYFGPSSEPGPAETQYLSPVGGLYIQATGLPPQTYLWFNEPVSGSLPWTGSTGNVTNTSPEAGATAYNNWGQYGTYYVRILGQMTAAQMQSQKYPVQVEDDDPAAEGDPANKTISFSTSRNGIYVLILRQASPSFGDNNQVGSLNPQFYLSIQSRFAFYDN